MRTLLLSALIALCSSVGAPALAQEETPTSPKHDAEKARQDEAREILEAAFHADDAGESEKAVELYSKSFELYPSFDVACNLGTAELDNRQYVSAANHLSYCLRNFPSAESRKLKKTMEGNLAVAKKHVGTVKVDVGESGAQVSIAGRSVGESPIKRKIYVAPGTHRALLEKHGESVERRFSVEKGGEVVLVLRLNSDAPEPSGSGAYGQVSARDAETSRRPSWSPAYVLGGVTVATAATAIIFRILANRKADRIGELDAGANQDCTGEYGENCTELRRAVEAYDDYANVSNMTMIATGIAAAATLGYVSFAAVKRSQREARVRVGVGFDPGGFSLGLTGRF